MEEKPLCRCLFWLQGGDGYGQTNEQIRRYIEKGLAVVEVFSQKSGEGFVDTALKILISVVVGALLLAGLYTLFKDTILPTLTQKITSLFNYQG